jgi:hypothetical protein
MAAARIECRHWRGVDDVITRSWYVLRNQEDRLHDCKSDEVAME